MKVEFDAAGGWVPAKFIRHDVLARLKAELAAGSLRFLSFDEHPRRVLAIEDARAAVIRVRQIADADCFPQSDEWEPVGLENLRAAPSVPVAHGGRDTVRPLDGLRIGTLSSERRGDRMRVADDGNGVEGIMAVLHNHAPDVLLPAGYALDDDTELGRLDAALNLSQWDGLLFVEVRNSDGSASFGKPDGAEGLCLFAWTRDAGMRPLARQIIATSGQAQDMRRTGVAGFEATLAARTIRFRGLSFGALICGEINVLQGRNAVQPLTTPIGAWLDGLDVLVNPTHDLMGNAGTLIAKRSHVSRDDRLYISASNWNSSKAISGDESRTRSQSRTAPTLHTVFRDGRSLPQERIETDSPMEYREILLFTPADADRQVPFVPVRPDAGTVRVADVRVADRIPARATAASAVSEGRTSQAPKGQAARPFWALLREVFPDVQCERRMPWLILPRGDGAVGLIAEARAALIAHCTATQATQPNAKKRGCGPDLLAEKLNNPGQPKLEFDFFVPSLNLALEFDERQHFTRERLVTLEICEKRLNLDFPVEVWKQKCARIAAADPDPIWRDWQRAYRDVARDILAAQHGISLVRVAFDAPAGRDDLEALRARLEPSIV